MPLDGATEDWFGFSVAISGNTAVVGAPKDNDNGTESGSAYVFNATTGQQLFKLLPLDGQFSDQFGISVGVSGTTAIVGSWQDDDLGDFSGAAYLFDTTTGLQVAKLLPTDGTNADLFGRSVAIDGTIAVIGAHGYNGFLGTAYIFDTSTELQLFKLLPGDFGIQMSFGWSVAVSGTTAIVCGFQNIAGAAYLFDTTTGLQFAKLRSDDAENGDDFAISVAISGDTVICGADFDDDNGLSSGSAYIFDPDCAAICPADLDGDGQGDLADLFFFVGCMTGPGQPIVPGCEPADIDGDGDVDAADFALFQATFGCP